MEIVNNGHTVIHNGCKYELGEHIKINSLRSNGAGSYTAFVVDSDSEVPETMSIRNILSLRIATNGSLIARYPDGSTVNIEGSKL